MCRRYGPSNERAILVLATGSDIGCTKSRECWLTASVIQRLLDRVGEERVRLDVDVAARMVEHPEGQADHLRGQQETGDASMQSRSILISQQLTLPALPFQNLSCIGSLLR